MLGTEHERIHVETSSVLIRQLPIGSVSMPEGWTYGPTSMGELTGYCMESSPLCFII